MTFCYKQTRTKKTKSPPPEGKGCFIKYKVSKFCVIRSVGAYKTNIIHEPSRAVSNQRFSNQIGPTKRDIALEGDQNKDNDPLKRFNALKREDRQ